MENFCTQLELKDKLCTNGFNTSSIKIITNIVEGSVIDLKVGFFLKILSTDLSTLDFCIYNSFFTANFSMLANSKRIFSLPCEGGLYLLELNYTKINANDVCLRNGD